jgi:hypothetical protein
LFSTGLSGGGKQIWKGIEISALITVVFLALTQGREAEERSIDLPNDEPGIVRYMLRFMYERDYRLPSDDAPRPFWTRCKDPLGLYDASEPAQEWVRRFETAVWSRSVEAIQKLRKDCSHLVEARYMFSMRLA